MFVYTATDHDEPCYSFT